MVPDGYGWVHGPLLAENTQNRGPVKTKIKIFVRTSPYYGGFSMVAEAASRGPVLCENTHNRASSFVKALISVRCVHF